MAKQLTKILLVEGVDDQCFFKQFIKKFTPELSIDVEVVTPKDLNEQGYNTKQGALEQLSVMTKGTEAVQIGLIVDADLSKDGGGCLNFLVQLNKKLEANRFASADKNPESSGYMVQHSVHSCGVWIMPNNNDDGIFEDWLADVAQDREGQELKNHAKNIVENLPCRNFRKQDFNKAYISTWLSWQSKPRGGALNIFDQDNCLIDGEHERVKHLIVWLRQVFGA